MTSAVLLWRIAKATPDFAADDLSGGGARKFGGRWNRKGTAMVYASQSIALACLETLAHIGDGIAARNRFLVEISVPARVWTERRVLTTDKLPPSWLAEPPAADSMALGSAWVEEGASALLQVPSVLVHEEANILINPAHPDARHISARVVRQFIYDPRW
ncbi:RES family NAD+ phosphorylase, partial [Chitinimonas sp.]|uniref:RES family NAD+ phosphorylase n=1 Tax=Chitinimonas sp. TaxID=1934313 RepID=UPI002F958A2D